MQRFHAICGMAVLFTLLAVPGVSHAFLGFFEHPYKVVFDAVPALADDNVYMADGSIGTITNKERKGEGVVLTLDIRKEHTGVMRDTTVFVVQDGRLVHAALSEGGTPLPEGSNVLGFTDTLQLNLFRARLVMQDIGGILRKSADDIAKKLVTFMQ